MQSNDGRNPDIPDTAYEVVRTGGKLEMGHFSFDILVFNSTGEWPLRAEEREFVRLKCFPDK
jgi:hypothetical protein